MSKLLKKFWDWFAGNCTTKRHGLQCRKSRGHDGRHKFVVKAPKMLEYKEPYGDEA